MSKGRSCSLKATVRHGLWQLDDRRANRVQAETHTPFAAASVLSQQPRPDHSLHDLLEPPQVDPNPWEN